MERGTHGLCRKCYKAMHKQVKDGVTTWDDLVAQGIATPAIERSRAHADNVAEVLRSLGLTPREDRKEE